MQLLKEKPGTLKLLEDGAQHLNLIQDHQWFIKEYYREKNEGSTTPSSNLGRAVNPARGPTTWEELGIDPKDPLAPLSWMNVVIKGHQGMDRDKAAIDAAKQKNIQFAKVGLTH